MFADNGIMFTKQIQEYLEDGVLIMPTSFSKSSFFSSLAKLDNLEIKEISKHFNFFSNFVIQIQSKNKFNINNLKNSLFLTYKLNSLDLEKIKKYFFNFIEFLFSTGAVEIYLPLKKNYKINKNLDRVKFIEENVMKNILKWFRWHVIS